MLLKKENLKVVGVLKRNFYQKEKLFQILYLEQANNKRFEKKSSKYKGVSWCKNKNKWEAFCDIDGKRIHLGRFISESDAFTAVQKYGK